MAIKEWTSTKKWNPFNSDKLLTQVYRWKSIKHGEKVPAPALITVDPINACNFQCEWCINGDEMITTTYMKHKKIRDAIEGEIILGINKKGRISPNKIIKKFNNGKRKSMIKFIFDDGDTLICTEEHKIWHSRGRWKRAINFKVGDCVKKAFSCSYTHTENVDYKEGYVAGMAQGDGCLWLSKNRNSPRTYRFRLVLKETECVKIFQKYCEALGINSHYGKYNSGHKFLKGLWPKYKLAVYTTSDAESRKIKELMEKEEDISDDFVKGWIAGIFDAEGSFSSSTVLRISQNPGRIKSKIERFCKRLGYNSVSEDMSVRIRSTLYEKFNFFTQHNPKIFYKRSGIFSTKVCIKKKIIKMEKIYGDFDVYDLETELGNYLVNGVLVHNCNANYILNKNHKKLSKDMLMQIADFLPNWPTNTEWPKGTFAQCIAGGGEPTLHPDLGDYIDRCIENGVETGIVTNGSMMDKFLPQLSKCTWIGVSVDAGCPQTFKDNKGVDLFDKVTENIEELIKYSKKHNTTLNGKGQGYGISYKFLLHPSNVYDIEKAIKMAYKLGCKNFHLRPAGVPWDKLQDPSAQINFTLEMIDAVNEQIEKCRVLEDESFGIFGITHKFGSRLERSNQFKYCYALFMTAVLYPGMIDNTLNIGLCCDRRGDDGVVLGSDLKNVEDINNLWGSKKHWEIFDNLDYSKCTRCTFNPHNIIFENVILNDNMTYKFI